MENVFNYTATNWTTILPIVIIVITETLPFVKSVEANGILQAILNILKKLGEQK